MEHLAKKITSVVLGQSMHHSTVARPLQDTFGRHHDYLRISLTERCNLRCRYCMPENGVQLSKREECLNLLELQRISRIFVELCGIIKIRLTGGEPTIDKKLIPLMEYLKTLRSSGLQTVAMTTNGINLKRHASTYKNLGLDAINISLDSLKEERFELMTRRRGWNLVVDGLKEALAVQFNTVKLNCVVMRGFNDDEIIDFAKLALEYPIEVRFIEFMPFLGNKWAWERMMPYKEILQIVLRRFPELKMRNFGTNETSKVYKDPKMIGSIGFISSMSDNFCSGCNRLRLTSDGNLKVCLFGREETSLRDLMRNGATDTEIAKAIVISLKKKKKQHAGATILQQDVSRPMVKIAKRMYHNSSSGDNSASADANFSHLDSGGKAKMVNINEKSPVKRIALAQGKIFVGHQVLEKILDHSLKKGDILTVSKVAGIMGAKSTSHLIPLCHQIALDYVNVDIEPCKSTGSLLVSAQVEAHHRTGVEMESLTAVAITLLTIYDMCKSVNKSMVISDLKVISKIKC